MAIDNLLEEYGFEASSSCSGFSWFTKKIDYKGKKAFITLTDEGGTHLPESLDKPVLVSTIDLDSGEDLEAARRFETLKSYLDMLNPITE